MKKLTLIFILSISGMFSCGYGFSSLKNRWEAKGINTIEVPVFNNLTLESGAEVFFTNALRLYLTSRSGKLQFVRSNADAIIEGVVKSVTLSPAGVLLGTEQTQASGGVPSGRILAQTYLMTATIELKMVRVRDKKEMWRTALTQSRSLNSGTFTDERRSSNMFIRESNKQAALLELSDQMMKYAVDSLLEEF